MKIVAVVGARPNFIKIAPLLWEAKRYAQIKTYLVHTGQHYDEQMSQVFFKDLNIPRPDINLEVGPGSHAAQTAEVMKRFEPVLVEQRPDLIVVVGDVNSTLACAVTAVKMGIPVAHVEAGLRSNDRSMPEEINRLLTDAISEWLFITEPSAANNLRREGVPGRRVFFVGNVMIDALLASKEVIERSVILEQLGLSDRPYAVMTLHRPGNVEDPSVLRGLLEATERLQRELPIIFPVHPRTAKRLAGTLVESMPNLRLIQPLGYLDFMKLVTGARFVLTDSGGIQEETTVLGVPCLTLRQNTERPVTVEQGTNILVGLDPGRIIRSGLQALARPVKTGTVPRLWDGKAARRIIGILAKEKFPSVPRERALSHQRRPVPHIPSTSANTRAFAGRYSAHAAPDPEIGLIR
jgi:UDP-N-acetylglucosamine 2-epimerase (non-hydrolysing)